MGDGYVPAVRLGRCQSIGHEWYISDVDCVAAFAPAAGVTPSIIATTTGIFTSFTFAKRNDNIGRYVHTECWGHRGVRF